MSTVGDHTEALKVDLQEMDREQVKRIVGRVVKAVQISVLLEFPNLPFKEVVRTEGTGPNGLKTKKVARSY